MTCFEYFDLTLDYNVKKVSIFSLLKKSEAFVDIDQLDAIWKHFIWILVVLKKIIEHFDLLQVWS